MAATMAPAHIVALALALFGIGLVVAAFVGGSGSAGPIRLLSGIVFLVIAMITSGLQLLARNGAGTTGEET